MKLKLLPLAIGAAIAMPGLALADAPTVYGKLNVSYENTNQEIDPLEGRTDDEDVWELVSNASRFGVKGSEKISNSLDAIYQIEWQVDTTGDGSDLSQRNRFVGLKGGFGEFVVGKFDTPLKASQGKIDQFNDSVGDIKNLADGEIRANDILQYSSPKIADAVQFKLAVMPGETTEDDGPADYISASVAFSTDVVYLALAVDDEVAGKDIVRLVGQVKAGAVEVGALIQRSESSESSNDYEADSLILSGAVKVGSSGKIKGQIGMLEVDGGSEGSQLALGYDHSLSKQTKVYGFINVYDYEDVTISLAGTEIVGDLTTRTLGVGMEHKF